MAHGAERFIEDCEPVAVRTDVFGDDVDQVVWDPDGRLNSGCPVGSYVWYAFTSPDRSTPVVFVPMDRDDQMHEAMEVFQTFQLDTHILSEAACEEVDVPRFNELLNRHVTLDFTSILGVYEIESVQWSNNDDHVVEFDLNQVG